MPSLSYHEKSLYGTLAVDLAVYITYLQTTSFRENTLGRIVGVMVVLIVLQIIVQSIIAVASRSRLTDERDRTIRLRGYRAGYFSFVAFVFVGLLALWLHTALGQLNPQHMAIHFLSAMFCFLLLSDVVKGITQLIDYRRTL